MEEDNIFKKFKESIDSYNKEDVKEESNYNYESKIITFEDGKLFCNGIEITYEEAEKIIKEQLKELDQLVEKKIETDLDLDKADIDELANLVVETKYKVSESTVKQLDLTEYYEAGEIIEKGLELCTRVLKPFLLKKLQISITIEENNKPEVILEWPNNINNDPNYEPSLQEQMEMGFIICIQEFIVLNFRVMFPIKLDLTYKDIFVQTQNNNNDFLIEIKKDDLYITFSINYNDKIDETVSFKYIGAGLKIGEIKIQEPITEVKNENNKFRYSQSIENIIIRQLRFLKNSIKEEVNYSLEKSLLRPKDRLKYALKIRESTIKIIDNKTLTKLNQIIEELEEKIKNEPSNQESFDIAQEMELINEDNENKKIEDLEIEIKTELLKIFDIKEEKSKFITKIENNNLYIETFLSNQKVIINVNNLNQITISSTNSIGTGKNDINELTIEGNNLEEKIKNIGFFAYLPIITRQIENIFSSIKNKKVNLKDIEKILKDAFYIIKNQMPPQKKGEQLITDIFNIIENLEELDDKNIIQILNIIDFILKELNYEMNLDIKIINFNYKENYITNSYKNYREMEDSIIEALSNLKKNINRIIKSNFLFRFIFDFNNEDKIENIDYIEESIKKLSNDISEDILLGSYARKILSLMNISKLSRDSLFKNNLENIILDINNIRFNG
ncbi:MAG: hypothetical protein U0457_01710 [Candidatus Sericytochromatia bacterium]